MVELQQRLLHTHNLQHHIRLLLAPVVHHKQTEMIVFSPQLHLPVVVEVLVIQQHHLVVPVAGVTVLELLGKDMQVEDLVAVVPERSEIRTGVMKAVMAFLLQSLEVPRSGLVVAVVVKPVEVMLAVLVVAVLATKAEPEAQETQTRVVVAAAQEMLVVVAAVLAVLALLS